MQVVDFSLSIFKNNNITVNCRSSYYYSVVMSCIYKAVVVITS